MKKLICLLAATFLLTGCQISKMDESSYDSIVHQVLTSNIDLHNQTKQGYRYYLPKTVSLYDSNDTNSILSYHNTRMYLYIDTVSYYNKAENEFVKSNDSYYSSEIKYQDHFGYLEINKYQYGYFVEMMYHYAKIETFVREDDLNDAVYNMITILSSIHYYDDVIASLIGDSTFNYKEEVYNIFEPVDTTDNSLNWEEDIYEEYNGEMKDEDSIIIEDGEE